MKTFFAGFLRLCNRHNKRVPRGGQKLFLICYPGLKYSKRANFSLHNDYQKCLTPVDFSTEWVEFFRISIGGWHLSRLDFVFEYRIFLPQFFQFLGLIRLFRQIPLLGLGPFPSIIISWSKRVFQNSLQLSKSEPFTTSALLLIIKVLTKTNIKLIFISKSLLLTSVACRITFRT